MTNTPNRPDLHLNAIEQRAAAATKGPWKVELEQCDCSDGLCNHGTYVSAIYADGQRRTDFTDFSDADWQFIIRARTDVPALVDLIRRLRAELERRTEDAAFMERTTLPELRREIEHHQSGKQRWRDRAEKAETQIAATRAKTLATEADDIVAHCPDHGTRDTAWAACHCPVADDMRRRAAGVVVPAASEETGR